MLMIENYRSGLLWRLMRDGSYIQDGLLREGFAGGWLGQNNINQEHTEDTSWPPR